LNNTQEELLNTLRSLLSLEKAIHSLLTTVVNTQIELKSDLREVTTSLAKLISMVGHTPQ